MRGKEMKKMDKGTNAKKLRNFGISLIIHDRRLSGVYILKEAVKSLAGSGFCLHFEQKIFIKYERFS